VSDPVSSNGHIDNTEESLEIGMQILHGEAIAPFIQDEFAGGAISVIPDIAVTVTDLESPGASEAAYGILSRVYPAEHPVLLVLPENVGTRLVPLAELAGIELDSDIPVTLLVPPIDKMEAFRSPHTLQYLVGRLRDEDGCPWDREQTNASMRDAVINEAYEVLDAIDDQDWDNLAEELGDLFLLIAMHSQIAEEKGYFALEDVFEYINRKIVRRHPHVFGDVEANDPDAVVQTWNDVKAQEKAEKPPKRAKDADGQPRSMPVLTRAARALKKQPLTGSDSSDDPGNAMLRIVSDLVESGQDPERVLRDALNRHLSNGI
jgi:tetrapyrrole methylase family protein/MazG family protein